MDGGYKRKKKREESRYKKCNRLRVHKKYIIFHIKSYKKYIIFHIKS